MDDWGADGWAVHAGEGQRVDTGSAQVEVLMRGEDVGSAMGAFVLTHPVIEANPPHAHGGFMKLLYVLEGDYEFRVGEATFPGGPGTLVVVPRASQHAFTTTTGGRVLFVCSPSGNEEMFLEVARLGPDAGAAQLAAVRERFQTYGLPGPDGEPWRPAP